MATIPNIASPELMLKVCGMRSGANIQDMLALRPNWLGFIFYPKSARFVGHELDVTLLKAFPGHTKKVGVFVNESLQNILDTVEKYALDAVQLHGDETPDLCRQLNESNLVVIKAFSVDEHFDFQQTKHYEGTCDYYLFDTKGGQYGGNGTRFNWDILKNYNGKTPFFLSGGIDLEHAGQIRALDLPLLQGIDVNSRFEISPALKDTDKVQKFFEQIRQRV